MRDWNKKYEEIINETSYKSIIKKRHNKIADKISFADFEQAVNLEIWIALKNEVGVTDLRTLKNNTIVLNATTKVVRDTMKSHGFQRINEDVEEKTEIVTINDDEKTIVYPKKTRTTYKKILEFIPKKSTSSIAENLITDEHMEETVSKMVRKLKENDIPFFLDIIEGLTNIELQKKYSMSPQSVSNKKKRIKDKLNN